MRLTRQTARLATVAAALALAAATPAAAQMSGPAAPSADEGATVSPPMGPGMMGGYGYGQMGPGMMQGYGMGPGAMQRYGMGPGMMRGYGYMGPGMMRGYGYGHMMGRGLYGGYGRGMGQTGYVLPPLDLSVADVQGFFASWVARTGNSNIKLGKVTEKDKTTITVDIVTKDGSLVEEFDVDRATGFYHPAG